MIELIAALALQAAPGGWSPPAKDPYRRCVCEATGEAEVVRFRGAAVDAIVAVGPDGRTPQDRQATLFTLMRPVKGLAAPVKVWHLKNPHKCGVTFDYGKLYDVVAVKSGEELETSYCLMPKKQAP